MKYLEKIQGLLPLGYLYLIILGLLKESILFYQLDVNILKYSSITDILISPLADMTSSPILIIVVISVILFFFIIQTIIFRNSHTNWGKKLLGSYKIDSEVDKKGLRKAMIPIFGLLVAIELLALFVGLGIGQGNIIKKRIESQDLKYNYKITSGSGAPADIYLIDINSTYYFYVSKGNKNIIIAPVGNIGTLEVIKKN
ncbi:MULTISPECIES: hypothetical protein [Chryseobacterium]|jgi:hypothetical protein|uniref:RDD domain-containing protein n=1 Tax=Chryseobacterium lathyri TaxID=395933 RepID=A0A511YAM8_9FLAO|nr:hypothetical protein [Chryseobacterium lathyri]GEN72249.1 hypothetical protein CLA01_23210 [Chryseobacterium lathyri]